MKPYSQPGDADAAIRRRAAEWLVRRDRGLSAQESIEFELWLADDECHAVAWERVRKAWSMLDRIADKTAQISVQAAVQRRRLQRIVGWAGLAAAAAAALLLAPFRRAPTPERVEAPAIATTRVWANPQIVTLSDGTLVRLNAGSEVRERFSTEERRVGLARGEAHFTVVKNSARPFVVEAGTVEARAVGTAFNVSLQSAAVEILVTEGVVAVRGVGASGFVSAGNDGRLGNSMEGDEATVGWRGDFLLTAHQRAVVALGPNLAETAVAIADLNEDEITRRLAWQEPLLRLSGATLGELAAEFQRRTGHRLVLTDASLAGVRIGGRFRGDDVEGFVRILEENYGIASESTTDGAVVLRRAASRGR